MAACSYQNPQSGNLICRKVFTHRNEISYVLHINFKIFAEKQKKTQKILVVSYPGERNGRSYCMLSPHDADCHNGILENNVRKRKIVFLDVNSICYNDNKRNLRSFAQWISLFFKEVSHKNPVIAVLDGNGGNEYRRQLLASYKVNRRTPKNLSSSGNYRRGTNELIHNVLRSCNVPVVEKEGHEADDVVATLVKQVADKGHMVIIASSDKDFRQLLSENVQIAMPVHNLNRWSFYTVKHYISQFKCDPISDISLRCLIGDEVDGVPGIHQIFQPFGRKTALKLLRKHGTLENILNAAAVRVICRRYLQDALTMHAELLRKNYEVLSLRRDVDVRFEDEWLSERNSSNDSAVLSQLFRLSEQTHEFVPYFTSKFFSRP